MRNRRLGPPPLPPPLGGIALDGSNLVADAHAFLVERLQLAVQWFTSWRPDLAITVFLDASTRRPDADIAAALQGIEAVTLRLCRRSEVADVLLLQHARQQRALLVSNDRFSDHGPLRSEVITLQFIWSPAGLEPFAEATWFRARGQAVRVPLTALRG